MGEGALERGVHRLNYLAPVHEVRQAVVRKGMQRATPAGTSTKGGLRDHPGLSCPVTQAPTTGPEYRHFAD